MKGRMGALIRMESKVAVDMDGGLFFHRQLML